MLDISILSTWHWAVLFEEDRGVEPVAVSLVRREKPLVPWPVRKVSGFIQGPTMRLL